MANDNRRKRVINIDLSRGENTVKEKGELQLTDFSAKKKQASNTQKKADKPVLKTELADRSKTSDEEAAMLLYVAAASSSNGKPKKTPQNKPQAANAREKAQTVTKNSSQKKSENERKTLPEKRKKINQTADKQSAKPKARALEQTGEKDDKKSSFKLKRTVIILLSLILLSLVIFAGYWFICANTIVVEGNTSISDEDIIALSGIKTGDHFFTIDKQKCEEGIESNPLLDFIDISLKLPDTLTVKVTERIPSAQFMLENGKYLVVNNEGIAVSVEQVSVNTPIVEGLGINLYSLSKAIRVDDDAKLEKLKILLSEIKAHYLIDQLSDIDITLLSNIKLKTNDGIEIHFGDIASQSSVCKKVTWIQSVLPELKKAGYSSGILTVSSEEQATFEPTTSTGEKTEKIELSDIGEAVHENN